MTLTLATDLSGCNWTIFLPTGGTACVRGILFAAIALTSFAASLSIGSDAAPLAWDLVAAWGTLLARLFVRRPQAAVHAVASAAAAEEGVAFLFSHRSLTVA